MGLRTPGAKGARAGAEMSCSNSAPARLASVEARELSARASALNKQARQMEDQITAHLAGGGAEHVDEAILQSRAQLNAT